MSQAVTAGQASHAPLRIGRAAMVGPRLAPVAGAQLRKSRTVG
jgi:hypothetical protein